MGHPYYYKEANMQIIERNFSGNTDLEAIAELVHKFPTENLHVVDLPYRFSSWSFDYPENIRLWTDENDQLLAWAILQVPFWTIDYAYHPETGQVLHRQILNWADEHAQKIVNTPSGHPAWYVTALASQVDRIHDLEQAGFASQANVGEDFVVTGIDGTFHANLRGCKPARRFSHPPLNGADEVNAYVDLHRSVFESKNMTIGWRNRTLQRPEYISDIDLVAVAPDGRLAAFCICWLAKDKNGNVSGQIEPLGVHADFRKLGLGWAILTKGLKRLSARGATQIYVQTDNYRNAAFKLYESAGFRVMHDILIYRKDY